MKDLVLSEIYIYPVKSLGGIKIKSADAGERGLKYDRRYLLVDDSGSFLTQREYPQLALLKLSIEENRFKVLDTKNGYQIYIPFEFNSGDKMAVKIWSDVCNAIRLPEEINLWFSRAISKNCTLVYMPDDERRFVEKKYVADEHIVSFADAYPYLIIGQSSLDDLNSRLDQPVKMDRFRPNFVFRGGDPYEEDTWKDFEINDVLFSAVKPCARCVITTTDQKTGARQKEPLKTLSTYRTINNKVMFGMNVVAKKSGRVSVGSKIKLV